MKRSKKILSIFLAILMVAGMFPGTAAFAAETVETDVTDKTASDNANVPEGAVTPDGTTPDGATSDGTTTDGTTPDGATPDGTTSDGTTTDGTTPDGTTPDGTTPDGTTTNGTTPDGTTPDGTTPDGTTPDGTTPDGTTPDSEKTANDEEPANDETTDGEEGKTLSAEPLAEVFLDNVFGDDANDGATESTAVKTFARAKELLAENGTIWLVGTYKFSGTDTWSLAEKGNAMVKRYKVGSTSSMIEIMDNSSCLTLENIVLDGGKDRWPGGIAHDNAIVFGYNGGKLILNSGAVLQNNDSSYMGSGVSGWNGFELVMNGGSAIRGNENHGHEYGGGVLIADGTFIMNGGSISSNASNRGGGVAIVAGNFQMNGGSIDGNRTYANGPQPGYGGGLYISGYEEFSGAPATAVGGNASFTMTGGSIQNNHAQSVGGGILTFPQQGNKVTLNISGGQISNNYTEDSGGGICMYFKDSALNMTGGEISNNTAARYGGGIYQYQTVDATLNGGSVVNNNAAWDGGGAYLTNGSRLMLYSGAISGNCTDGSGGGVDIERGSLFWMAGGEVKENIAKMFGGGVYIPFSSRERFHMIGGLLQGNSSEMAAGSDGRVWRGDGVYVGGTFEIGKNAVISPDNDVFLLSNQGKHIEVISPFTGNTGEAPIQITSNTEDVEDQQIGTKLVHYSEKAGGAEAAAKADADGIFVPSSYMPEELMIGESAYEKDWMTYVPTVEVSYKWVGETHPTDTEVPTSDTIRKGTEYTAKEQQPTQENYLFKGWFTDEDCTAAFADGTKIDASTTLYGKWVAITPVNVEISGEKTLDGKAPKGSNFEFTLTDEAGQLLQTKPAVDGKISFDPLTFDAAGTYKFKVSEKVGADEKIEYDKTVYDVTVEVALDENSNSYIARISYAVDGQAVDAITFKNTTKPVDPDKPVDPEKPDKPDKPDKPEKPADPTKGPKTGDSSNIMMWALLCLLSVSGITAAQIYIKKKGKENR